jgi:choline dehydrogenase-like flavoprotein
MPGKNEFDAIVIGSGITGGWAAKELCEKGLKTLMLERGRYVEHIKDYTTTNLEPWEIPYGGGLTTEDKKIFPIQVRHHSIRGDNKQFYNRDIENPYREIQRYDWIRGDILGGRSLLWGRLCYRWSDLDFEANEKDGHGVDWPIRYRDIAPWYDYVERFIGVSGSRESIPHLPDSQFQAAQQLNCVEQHLKGRFEQVYPGRKLIIGRVANLTEKLPGRSSCQYRNLCHRGCPFGAYFSTQSSTLPAALATGNLTVRTGTIVNRIIYDEEKQRAAGVEYIDRETKNTYEVRARLIFLNASTLGTTFLLLHSTSSRFPNGLGNDHDLVGRFLMDHHKSGSVSGEIEGFEDKYYYGRRPNIAYIPRFRNLYKNDMPFLRGYHFQAGAWRARGTGQGGIGAALKSDLTEPGAWRTSLTSFGECLPYAENRISLDPELKDAWGRPALAIDCGFKENEKTMREDAITQAQEILSKIGAKDIRIQGTMSFPGNANHEMGTARMGKDVKTSVLNKWNQMHSVKNLFITDGSCMASSSSVNPSLTYMAITARACDFAVRELKKGNI